MFVKTVDDGIEVTDFDLVEEFSLDLLTRFDLQGTTVENGHIVISATNGTWYYTIVGFSARNGGASVHCELARYER